MGSKKYTFIDLFAGCGGLSEGFLATGNFEGLAHVEWELPMVKTLRNRLNKKWNHSVEESKKRVIHFDIQKTKELINGDWSNETCLSYETTNHNSIKEIGIRGIVEGKRVDFIIGGPPCQAYSMAGRAQDKNSMKDDYRNFLFESFVKVVNEFKPKAFVFENVPGMLSAKPGNIKVTDRVYKAFQDIGYEITIPSHLKDRVYVAEDFEVPQKRKRLIIVGVKSKSNFDLGEIYNLINQNKSSRKKNVRDAIGHLPKFYPLKQNLKIEGKNVSHQTTEENIIKHHEPRFHNVRDIEIFKEWVTNKMNLKNPSEKIDFYNKKMNKKSKHAKYRNLEWDKSSPTIVAHLYKDGLMFIHPDEKQARSITVKEAAILQSFPDDYEFIGSNGHCYKMIGNAVPPKMAKAIAIALSDYFKEI